jgi:hypothetical protein
MSYIVHRGRWCSTIDLYVHAPNEEKSNDSKDRFYKELEQVCYHFPKYNLIIILGVVNEIPTKGINTTI